MKTTIIDLLNKIANGENVPRKIIYFGLIYEYCDKCKQYENLEGDIRTKLYEEIVSLNDEVEILETTITYNQDNIENNKQDKIKKIPLKEINENMSLGVKNDMYFAIKINEIIDYINKRGN